MIHNRNNTEKAKMFLRRYLFLNFFLACGITFHSSYGSDLKNRKQIYDMYVSLNKFVGEWIDPYSLGIFDGNIEFEEELEDSYTVHSEEIMINKKETWKSPESFSGHRTLLKNKLKDGSGIGGIFVTESNTVFSLGRNLMTVSAILTFVVFILFLFFPKTLIFSFVLIVSMLWHWMKLYQEKIAEKQNLTENLRHPNECRRGDLHWYEAISLYLSSYASSPTDCKEYYKAQLVDPFWEVSLPVAMMNAFTSTVCEPMKVFATTVRFCFAVIFSGLTMLELSITLFSIFIFLLMQYGYSFNFCWGAISLYRPRNSSADQITSHSISLWGSITKYVKAFFFRENPPISPTSDLCIPPDNKKVSLCNKSDKTEVSEKYDEFQKQEKSTDNVRQIATLQSGSLNSEKNNHGMVALKISQLCSPPDNKNVALCNKGDKTKVSEKHDEFQKQEKSTDNVRQIATLQSGSLNSEKNNHRMVALKISQLCIPPDNKNVALCNKGDKTKVSEKPDGFLKQEQSTDNVRQIANLQSGSLNSEKNNHGIVALKISQFRKCHKKSFSS